MQFHRSLKAVVLTDGNWVNCLLWVMLGLYSMATEDLGASPAELVLGQSVCVPGVFFLEAPLPQFTPSAQQFLPHEGPSHIPDSMHLCLPQSFVPKILELSKFVFVRHDAHRAPLWPLYDGPFRILEPGPKHLLLVLGGGCVKRLSASIA